IDMNHPNTILLGTEYGVWSSDDNGATWAQSTGFPKVPTLCLRQQLFSYSPSVYGTGIIYAGTHGRGAWKTNSLVGIKDISSSKTSSELSLTVSPNPSRDIASVSFYADKPSNATLKIFSLQGKLIQSTSLPNMNQGKNHFKFSVEEYDAGTYIVVLNIAGKQSSAKFVVVK
ncbi:MAG: T9SS type A sorting domain-containing protein, partial [Flavobacterium sp.]